MAAYVEVFKQGERIYKNDSNGKKMAEDFKVLDKNSIGSVLKSLERNRSMLGIVFRGIPEIATSMVIGVDTKQGVFLLDGLSTDDANALVRKGRVFAVRGSDQGVDLFFQGIKVRRQVRLEDGMAYEAGFPEEMEYRQRRNDFRLQVNQLMTIEVEGEFSFEDEVDDNQFEDTTITLHGQLSDLSLSGCRFTMFKVKALPFPEEVEVTCKLTWKFPGVRHEIVLSGLVRHHVHSVRRSMVHIGIEFFSMETQLQDIIERFIVQSQFLARRHE